MPNSDTNGSLIRGNYQFTAEQLKQFALLEKRFGFSRAAVVRLLAGLGLRIIDKLEISEDDAEQITKQFEDQFQS